MSVVELLKKSTEGLLMMSESDYPFEVFLWEGQVQEPLTSEKLLQLTHHSSDSPVESVDIDYFFRNVAQEKDWHDDDQRLMVKRFQSLVEILKTNLNELQVYRVGAINIDVYIVGKTNSSDLAGVTTKLVET
jgi:hypothetical protein